MSPTNHKLGQGCLKCSGNYKRTYEEWVEEFNKVHNFKFTYPEQIIKSDNLIRIICPDHKEFSQKANDHLRGIGCAKCSGVGKKTTEQWIESFRETHGNRFDYSLVKDVSNYSKVSIICPVENHGVFIQTAGDHRKRFWLS